MSNYRNTYNSNSDEKYSGGNYYSSAMNRNTGEYDNDNLDNDDGVLTLNAGYNWFTSRRDRTVLEQRRDINITTSLLLRMRGKGSRDLYT
jgi:hypothetical protein